MAAPHAIHEEFPDAADRIHALKLSNGHFARLLDDYDSVNDRVAGAESRQTPMSAEAETDLRKERARLKDEIARMLAGSH
ncbi:YdcH family protein [Paracoccus endophyticus]|uniref:YdcH family protein n=1 Tax=Paracoccus endophyticus TaxID=2233774 RepID=UPI000DD91258|nr:YdcH family protein [Paracoccus endophyticus]